MDPDEHEQPIPDDTAPGSDDPREWPTQHTIGA